MKVAKGLRIVHHQDFRLLICSVGSRGQSELDVQSKHKISTRHWIIIILCCQLAACQVAVSIAIRLVFFIEYVVDQ
jgi:hypothetical protein